jgi:hypothetical protein
MSVSVGKKLSHETPMGLCTVVGIRGGQLMEIRRFGKTFIAEAVEGFLPASERRKFPTEAAWRDWVDVAAAAPAPVPGTKIHYETAKGTCTIVGIRGGLWMEIRRFGSTFTPCGYVAGERVVCHPYSARRKFGTEAEWRAFVDAECTPPAPAPASPEACFWTRIQDIPCNRIFQVPSAKDEAVIHWANADLSIIWLYVQTSHGIIPVCRNWKGRVLRFLVDGEFLTFAEAGIPVDAPLWMRKPGSDPTLVPV